MRLGQLARKLELSPTELINFLMANNIQTAEGSNTRLSDDQVRITLERFDPAGLKQITPTKNIIGDTEIVSIPPEIQEKEIKPSEEPLPVDDSKEVTAEEIRVELIKAQKIELSGLKVLGKIELPEPKKKEPVFDQEATPAEEIAPQPRREPRQEGRKSFHQKNDRRSTASNPIALQREREARESEKKRQAQAKLDKEKRTQHYLQKVKISVPTKPARLVDEHVIEIEMDHTKTPKTWLGKFWKWFRS